MVTALSLMMRRWHAAVTLAQPLQDGSAKDFPVTLILASTKEYVRLQNISHISPVLAHKTSLGQPAGTPRIPHVMLSAQNPPHVSKGWMPVGTGYSPVPALQEQKDLHVSYSIINRTIHQGADQEGRRPSFWRRVYEFLLSFLFFFVNWDFFF